MLEKRQFGLDQNLQSFSTFGLHCSKQNNILNMRIVIFILLALIPWASQAQYGLVKLEDVERIEESTIIIAESKDAALTQNLKGAMDDVWTFSDVTAPLPLSGALKRAKANRKYLVIEIATLGGKMKSGEGKDDYQVIREGVHLQIRSFDAEPLVRAFIPKFGKDGIVTKEAIVFGLQSMQYLLKTMMENQLKHTLRFQYAYRPNSSRLKLRTLLIPEGWADSDLDRKALRDMYPGPAEVVPYKRWKAAILQKKRGYAYAMIVPTPHGDGEWRYYHYIVDAEQGIVFGLLLPSDASLAGDATVPLDNMGYINQENIPDYVKVLGGRW